MQLVMNLFLQCGLLLALSHEVGAASVSGKNTHQLRRSLPEQTISKEVHEAAKVIPGVEIPGAPDRKKRMMDAISKFRAEICYKMKVEHGIEFESFEACNKFMDDACKPGKDKRMDGDRKEVTSGEGYCEEYFPEAEKKAKKKVDDEDAAKEKEVVVASPFPAPGPSPMPAPLPAPAPEKKAPAPAPAAAGETPGPAPAPGPMGGPSPAAPVPAPFIPGVSAGKPWGNIADDEAYYYAKGGKDPMRLHMNSDMKLPTQGYWGKLVEHEDMKTSVGDWGHEFGPKSGHESFDSICRQHPNNPWCEEQGYGRHRRNACPAVSAHLLPLVFAFVAIRAI